MDDPDVLITTRRLAHEVQEFRAKDDSRDKVIAKARPKRARSLMKVNWTDYVDMQIRSVCIVDVPNTSESTGAKRFENDVYVALRDIRSDLMRNNGLQKVLATGETGMGMAAFRAVESLNRSAGRGAGLTCRLFVVDTRPDEPRDEGRRAPFGRGKAHERERWVGPATALWADTPSYRDRYHKELSQCARRGTVEAAVGIRLSPGQELPPKTDVLSLLSSAVVRMMELSDAVICCPNWMHPDGMLDYVTHHQRPGKYCPPLKAEHGRISMQHQWYRAQ